MLERFFLEVYTKFKLAMYKKIFSHDETQDNSLSAIENFCVETIYALNSPTVNQFSTFAQISAPNAAYKVNNLVRKGYIRKVQSEEDKREYHLEVTDQYLQTYGVTYEYVDLVMKRIHQRFSEEDVAKFEEILYVISSELMQEATDGMGNVRF